MFDSLCDFCVFVLFSMAHQVKMTMPGPPQYSGSNEDPQSMFGSETRIIGNCPEKNVK